MPQPKPTVRRVALALLLAFVAAACPSGGGGGDGPPLGQSAVIESFAARDEILYRAGASTELTWRVSGGPSTLLLVAQGGAAVDVTGRSSFVVTPPTATAVTYRLVASNTRGSVERELTIRFPTPTVVRGRLALDNLLDAAESGEPVGTALATQAAAFRADLSALAADLPARWAASGIVDPAAVARTTDVARVFARVVAPESVYAAESVVVVDAAGTVHDAGRVDPDGSWRVVVPQFGLYVLLRARIDAGGDLICFQPLEIESRGAGGRADAVQPLLIRSTPDFEVALGRFALNELTGHLSVVGAQVDPNLLLPPDLAPFFRISDEVLRCEHPDPAKLGVAAAFEFEAPLPGDARDDASGVNLPGTFDFGTLWLTNADDTAEDLTLASTGVDDGGQSAADLRFRADDPEEVLPIVHDTCLLNFDKCVQRFEEGGLLLPFVVPEDLAADLEGSSSAGVRVASTSSVRTAVVTGQATVASTGAAAALVTLAFQELDTGSIGLARTDRDGNYSVSLALPSSGEGTYVVSGKFRVGRTTVNAKIGCGSTCTFSTVKTYRGVDDLARSTNITF